jgi:hypothetical protein
MVALTTMSWCFGHMLAVTHSLKKIDTSFHQPLPNMVQRLFADVINDAIWFMNIHEQNHP